MFNFTVTQFKYQTVAVLQESEYTFSVLFSATRGTVLCGSTMDLGNGEYLHSDQNSKGQVIHYTDEQDF